MLSTPHVDAIVNLAKGRFSIHTAALIDVTPGGIPMNLCQRWRTRSGKQLSLLATVAVLALVPRFALAAAVSCETFNECTVGVCLPDGTCDETPANNGASCDTFNPCTTGTCSNGACMPSPANNGASCTTYNSCLQKNGKCAAGVCSAPALANGAACRQELLGPCLIGTCMSMSNVSFCVPEFKCAGANACDFKCNPINGNCETFLTHACDDDCTTGTCVPLPDFDFSCSNVQNRPNDTPCDDFNSCNGADACQAGVCTGSGSEQPVCGNGVVESPEQCDDGDTVFAFGEYCNAQCMLIACGKPTNSTGALPKAGDALFALKAGVGSVDCALSVCDVNHSNSLTASDALMILKKAVGLDITLNCPAA